MSEPGYTFVPGHGDMGNASDVAAFRNYLTTLRAFVTDARARGKSGDELVQSVVPALKEKFGTWDFPEPLAKMNVQQTEAEMAGTKRVPTPVN
jgi:hypothetical protein